MWRKLCQWLLYKRMGWTTDVNVELPERCIICLAPHTSNWDFVIGQLYGGAEGMKNNFLMKKEWFFWPLGPLFKRLGGIPVWREKHSSLTDNLAKTALESKTFRLCITPEGTRSLNTEWKKGFYFIAQKAQIPILLYGIDYNRKLIRCTKCIVPSGNVEEEMAIVRQYYKDFKGKHPERFSTGE